jgi:hypothetical protein
MYPLVSDQEQEPDQKKIPGIPPQRNDSSRVADGDVPGRYSKWRYEITRQVLSLDLLAPFRPEAKGGGLIFAHDDPGVRITDEIPGPMKLWGFQHAGFHIAPPGLYLSEKFLFTRMGEINPYGIKCQSNL